MQLSEIIGHCKIASARVMQQSTYLIVILVVKSLAGIVIGFWIIFAIFQKFLFFQYLEYYIDRGVLGVEKEGSNTILEYRGAPVAPRSRIKWDSQQNLVVPTMPPTMLGVCRLIQIYYVLKVLHHIKIMYCSNISQGACFTRVKNLSGFLHINYF